MIFKVNHGIKSRHPENVLRMKRSRQILENTKPAEKKEPKIKIEKDNYRHRRKTKIIRFQTKPKQVESFSREDCAVR